MPAYKKKSGCNFMTTQDALVAVLVGICPTLAIVIAILHDYWKAELEPDMYDHFLMAYNDACNLLPQSKHCDSITASVTKQTNVSKAKHADYMARGFYTDDMGNVDGNKQIAILGELKLKNLTQNDTYVHNCMLRVSVLEENNSQCERYGFYVNFDKATRAAATIYHFANVGKREKNPFSNNQQYFDVMGVCISCETNTESPTSTTHILRYIIQKQGIPSVVAKCVSVLKDYCNPVQIKEFMGKYKLEMNDKIPNVPSNAFDFLQSSQEDSRESDGAYDGAYDGADNDFAQHDMSVQNSTIQQRKADMPTPRVQASGNIRKGKYPEHKAGRHKKRKWYEDSEKEDGDTKEKTSEMQNTQEWAENVIAMQEKGIQIDASPGTYNIENVTACSLCVRCYKNAASDEKLSMVPKCTCSTTKRHAYAFSNGKTTKYAA